MARTSLLRGWILTFADPERPQAPLTIAAHALDFIPGPGADWLLVSDRNASGCSSCKIIDEDVAMDEASRNSRPTVWIDWRHPSAATCTTRAAPSLANHVQHKAGLAITTTVTPTSHSGFACLSHHQVFLFEIPPAVNLMRGSSITRVPCDQIPCLTESRVRLCLPTIASRCWYSSIDAQPRPDLSALILDPMFQVPARHCHRSAH